MNVNIGLFNVKLSIHKNELNISGEFKAKIRNQIRGTDMTFAIVGGKINSPPPLGNKAL